MATLASISSDIDSPNGWGDIIESLQAQCKLESGFYAQLLVSHTNTPQFNAPTAPDRLLDMPHDRQADLWCSWVNVLNGIDTPLLWQFSLRVDCVGPIDGIGSQGWDAIFETVDDGDIKWQRILKKRNGQPRSIIDWQQV